MANDLGTKGRDQRSQFFWYDVLTAFPFLFLPLVVAVGIILAWIMPIWTGVMRR